MHDKGKKFIKEANEFQKNSLRDGSASLNKVYIQTGSHIAPLPDRAGNSQKSGKKRAKFKAH